MYISFILQELFTTYYSCSQHQYNCICWKGLLKKPSGCFSFPRVELQMLEQLLCFRLQFSIPQPNSVNQPSGQSLFHFKIPVTSQSLGLWGGVRFCSSYASAAVLYVLTQSTSASERLVLNTCLTSILQGTLIPAPSRKLGLCYLSWNVFEGILLPPSILAVSFLRSLVPI